MSQINIESNRELSESGSDENKVIISSFDKNVLNQNISETKKTIIEKLEEMKSSEATGMPKEKLLSKAAKKEQEKVDEDAHAFSKEIFQYDYKPLEVFPVQKVSRTDFIKLTQKEGALSVLENLITQFERPTQYVRELVQNSIDANTSQINFDYAYDPDQKLSQLVITDDGEGMNYNEIKKYLLNLFESSKYQDRSKIGKFGIGFVSLFAIDPELVVVETTKDNKTYSVFLDSPRKGAGGKIVEHKKSNKHSGTQIRIFKKQTEHSFKNLSKDTLNELNYSCLHIKKPLFFNDEKLNKEFELENAHTTVRFGNRGIEGVIGLVPQGEETYRLYNNRLLIKDGKRLQDYGLSYIVSSKDLSPNLSRNDLIQDPRYNQIIKLLTRETSKLAEKVFEKIAYLTANPVDNLKDERTTADELKFLWKFANDYFDNTLTSLEKKHQSGFFKHFKANKSLIYNLPESILNSKVFKTIDDNIVSIAEVLASVKSQGNILYEIEPDSRVVNELLSQGVLILKTSKHTIFDSRKITYQTSDALLFQLDSNMRRVIYHYSLPSELPLDKLNDEEKYFLETARTLMKKTPLSKYVSELYLGDFSEDAKFHESPFKYERKNAFYNSLIGSSFYMKNLSKRETSRKIHFSESFQNKAPFVLNINHAYLTGLMDQAKNPEHSHLAYVNLFSLMATNLAYLNSKLIGKVNNHLLRYMKNES